MITRSAQAEPGVSILWTRGLRAQVADRLPGYAARLGAPGLSLRERPLRWFRHSVLVPFDGGRAAPHIGVVVKIHRHRDRLTAAAAEHAHLEMLRAHFGGADGLCVPAPLDHFAGCGALVMEQVFGPRLDHRIRRESGWGWRQPGASLASCRQAGEWLRHLARWNRPTTPTVNGGAERCYDRELEDMLRVARSSGMSLRTGESVEGVLAETTRDGTARPQPVHSDFSPYNAHAAPSALYFVDFAEMPLGRVVECQAFFWSGLELTKMHPLVAAAKITQHQMAFESGCGAPLSTAWRVWGLLRQLWYLTRQSPVPVGTRRLWYELRAAWIARRVRELVA